MSQLLVEFRKLEHRADGISSVPQNIDEQSVILLNNAKQGLSEYLRQNHQENILVFVIGCDLGTSSTKIVIRQAFAGGATVAMPVPEPFRDDTGHPHCWKTLLYLDEQAKTFSLCNGDGKREIKNIKTSIMGDASQIGSSGLTPDQAAAAYLGLILRYAKGWLYQNGHHAFGTDLKEYNIKWELNMGLPAATLDDQKIRHRFENILCTSWHISETDAPLTIDMVSQSFENSDEFKDLIAVRPEVTAETACFIESGSGDLGNETYVLVDIGASTLDICVFNYFHGDEKKKQAMLVAAVELLGVQSEQWLSDVTQLDGSAFSIDHLEEAIRFHIAHPIIVAKTKKYPQSSVWTGTLEILMAGGGVESELHQAIIGDFIKVFQKKTAVEEVLRIKPPVPKGLIHQADDQQVHRLAVAWGLSLQEEEFIEFSPPSDASDIEIDKPSIEDIFVTKDQV